MPTYDYVCDSCGHRFEEMQSFKDDPLKTCPQCHQDALRRLFGTGAAILFKGSGFYETDYRSESYKKAAQAESGTADKNGDGAKKADAPAKPAESKPADSPKPSGGTS